MIILKCKVCGGQIIETRDGWKCESCGTPVSAMSVDDDRLMESMNRANEARRTYDYPEAIRAYTQIIGSNPQNAEAHWNLALSKFGIDYVSEWDGLGRIRFKPNFHRLRSEAFDKDEDYRKAIRYADDLALEYYMSEGSTLTALQKKLLELVRTETDYDVFISFKAEDASGNRSRDSIIAEEIYQNLTARGVRTFFSRITLNEVASEEFEPHIFSALNSAKIMLLVGTDYSYINYGWVKNEWSRFLELMEKDKSRKLIPVCEYLPVQMLPKEIPTLEAVDYTKKDALPALVHEITRYLGKADYGASEEESKRLLAGAQDALARGDFAEATRLGKEAVNEDPENGEAWFLLLLTENHMKEAEELTYHVINWMDSSYFNRAYETSKGLRRQFLDEIKRRYDREQKRLKSEELAAKQAALAERSNAGQIGKARTLMNDGRFTEAKNLLYNNIVVNNEVERLRADCELGVEYETIDKANYLYREVAKAAPGKCEELRKRLKHYGEGKGGFSGISAVLSFILPFVMIFFAYRWTLQVQATNYGGELNSAIFVICMILLFICLFDSIIKGIIGGYLVSAVLGILLDEGKTSFFLGLAVVLALMSVYFFIRFLKSLRSESSKAGAYYAKQIQPMEQKLMVAYRQRYAPLAQYCPVAELTTVWELLLQEKKNK